MKTQNWPYLAGLIDGEGCLSAWKYWNKNRTDCVPYYQYSCRVGITNTNLVLMQKLVQHFGGGFLCKREATEKHKASYEWRPKGKRNTQLLLLGTLPHLMIKAEQAKLLLEWIDLGYGQQKRRDEIIGRLNILNQKGSVETETLNGDEPKIQSELTGDCESAPAGTQAIYVKTPLIPKTFREQAEHFQSVSTPVSWPQDEPDID
jgi:hypothetical protein